MNIRGATGKVDRPGIAQRIAAIFGLAGLVLAWGVVLIPCLIWLLFSLIAKRLTPLAPVRSQA